PGRLRCALVLVVGGEGPPPLVGPPPPVAVPALDQIAARLLACLGPMHHALGAIGVQRIAGLAIGEIARGGTLPVLPLTAPFPDFPPAVTFENRAEGPPRLDGLQLLRIADHHNFRAGLCRMG